MNLKVQTSHPKHLLEEAEKLKPSADPSYWAKKGCKDCNGRGIVGTVKTVLKGNNTIQQQLVCHCTKKNYSRWLDQTIEDLKKKAFNNENHS